MKKLFRIQLIFLLLITFWGCEKEMDKYYERPDWLRGSAYEVMKERGNFNLFLRAIDRAGYKSVVNGRELCTMMAPTDEAFQKYLKRHNYASVEDIPEDTLKLLVPYHMIKRAFEPQMLLAFTMDNGMDAKGNGTAYKYETYAQPSPFEMTDPLTGQRVKTYNDNLYLPIVSTRLYKTKECTDYEKNYEFFWPEVNWLGEQDQLYAQGAAVIEQGIPTDNGYLYILDDVCEPLRTVYQALEKAGDPGFSQFLELYDRFAEVKYRTISGATGDSLYNYYHYRNTSKFKSTSFYDQLPAIASTIAYHNDYNTRDDYFMYLTYTYNCFAPTDRALEDYFSRKFSDFYTSWTDLPQLTLYYFLMPYMKEGQEILLPERVMTDGVKGEYGETWTVTSEDVVNKEFCSNGIVYGIDKVFDPLVFELVCKPLFMNPNYSLMANMFFKADAISTLTDQTPDKYTLFVVPDSILESDIYNIRMNYGNNYFNDSEEAIEMNGVTKDKSVTGLPASNQVFSQNIAERSIATMPIRDFNKRAYYVSRGGDMYFYTLNNQLHDQEGNILEVMDRWETVNGTAYAINKLLYDENEADYRPTVMAFLKDNYKDFYDLLNKAGLVKTSSSKKYEYIDGVNLINEKESKKMYSAMYFIPADLEAWKDLPAEELKKRLQFCIVRASTFYILPGIEYAGDFSTLAISDESTSSMVIYDKLNISFDDYRLILSNSDKSSIASTGEEIPFFALDGMIIKIDNTIQAK